MDPKKVKKGLQITTCIYLFLFIAAMLQRTVSIAYWFVFMLSALSLIYFVTKTVFKKEEE